MENKDLEIRAMIYKSIVGILYINPGMRISAMNHVVNLTTINTTGYTVDKMRKYVEEAFYDICNKESENEDEDFKMEHEFQLKTITEAIMNNIHTIELWTEFISDIRFTSYDVMDVIEELLEHMLNGDFDESRRIIVTAAIMKHFMLIKIKRREDLVPYTYLLKSLITKRHLNNSSEVMEIMVFLDHEYEIH